MESIDTLITTGEVQVAPRPDEVTDMSYAPAETGDGLEKVGGLKGYWEDKSHWDRSNEIKVFGPERVITDPAVLEVTVRRAIVEALAVRGYEAGADAQLKLTDSWQLGGRQDGITALSVQISVADDGSVRLEGNVEAVVSALEDPAPSSQTDLPWGTGLLDSASAQAVVQSWDASWKSLSLDDAVLKFAVCVPPGTRDSLG